MNRGKAICSKLSPEGTKRVSNQSRKNSKAGRKGLLTRENEVLSEEKRDLKYMRIALANLEATRRLLTKHKVNSEVQHFDGNHLELFNLTAELGKLIDEAKFAVHACEDLVGSSKSEIAKLRRVAA